MLFRVTEVHTGRDMESALMQELHRGLQSAYGCVLES